MQFFIQDMIEMVNMFLKNIKELVHINKIQLKYYGAFVDYLKWTSKLTEYIWDFCRKSFVY